MGDLLSRKHEMTAKFVKRHSRDFLTLFLNESGIADKFYKTYLMQVLEDQHVLSSDEFLGKLLSRYDLIFGHLLGVAFARGYAACKPQSCLASCP